MAIPIRKCGKDAVPYYLSKFKVKIATEEGEGASEDPIVDRWPMNFAGPETGVHWAKRSVADRRRGNKVVDSIFSKPGTHGTLAKKGLFTNFSYGKEDPQFPMQYFKDLFKYHPEIVRPKGKAVTREVFMPKDAITTLNENNLYGLRLRTAEDLDFMICGKLDLALVRIAVLAHSMGKKNTIFELNIQAEAGGFLNPKTDEGAMFLNPREYETRLSDKLFELFDKKALIAHGQPVESSVELPVLTFPGVVDSPGMEWGLVIKAFKDFSINYSEAMKAYIYALADKITDEDWQKTLLFTKPDGSPNSDRYISLRRQHVMHADLPEAAPVRKEYFAGRIKRGSQGPPVREALFVNLDSIDNAWISKSKGILNRQFVNMLTEIEQYSRETAWEYDPEQTLSQYGDTRTIVFTSKENLSKADRPGEKATDADEISKIELDPISPEEARDVKIPHFLMSNLFGEKIQRGARAVVPDNVTFVFKIPIEIGGGERKASEIAKRGLAHLAEQRGDLVFAEIEALKADRDIQMSSFIRKDVERLDRVSNSELTDDQKIKVISNLFNDIIIKAQQEFRYLDPWERDEEGNLLDEEGNQIDLMSGKFTGKISKDGTMLIGSKEHGFFKYKHKGGSTTEENANPLIGLWENISPEGKADPSTYYQLDQNGEGKAVSPDAEHHLTWSSSPSNEEIFVSFTELLPKVPKFSEEMKEKVLEITNLSSGLSFKAIQRFLTEALWRSVERDEDESEKRDVVIVDKNYNYVYGAKEDPSKKGRYIKGENKYIGRECYVSNYKEFSKVLSEDYAENLFQVYGGENSGQQQEVFQAFTQEQIHARYSIDQEELKLMAENYKYIGKAESLATELEKSSKRNKGKENVDEWKQKFLDIMREVDPEFGLGNIRIRESAWDNINSIETLIKKIREFVAKSNKNTVLLYGPSGTGKTTFALHLANMLNYGCINWKLESTQGEYVGNTEHAVSLAFKIVKALRNQVLVLDEVDTLLGEKSGRGNNPGINAIQQAFLKEIDAIRPFLIKNNVILVSTTNDVQDIKERTVRRLTGIGKEGGTTSPIKLEAPTELHNIQNLVSIYVEKLDPWPSRDEFSRAFSEALAKKAKAKQPFAPYEIMGLLDSWEEPGIKVRSRNIESYIAKEKQKPLGPGETQESRAQKIAGWESKKEELVFGPKSIVKVVERTIPSSAATRHPGDPEFKFIPNETEANSAAFLLDAQQIAVEPSPGIGEPAAPATTPPKRKIPWGGMEEEGDEGEGGTPATPPPAAQVPAIPAAPPAPSIFPPRTKTKEKERTSGRAGSYNRNRFRSSFNFGKG